MPLLSLVIPTTGKPKNLFRCIDSITQNTGASLLKQTELIVFINPDPQSPVDIPGLERYLDKIAPYFASTQFEVSDKFELTAEESAYVAIEKAGGDYLWVSGDKRIYLPEGLAALENWLASAETPCAYINSIWIDSNSHTEGLPSVHFVGNRVSIPYKQFVMQAGVNFISTSMGAWIFERKYLDRKIWKKVIDECGPHFSHVTTLLATLENESVTCLASYFFLLESKAYHSGNDGEWAHYAKISDTYRFYAWHLGLVRQFNFLIETGDYTYGDVRRWMCSEGKLMRRQVDEIYNHLLLQIRMGWASNRERLNQEEFDEIMNFLERSCPERSILNRMLIDLYACYGNARRKEFTSLATKIWLANSLDHQELRFSTLLVEQTGDKYVRLHPRGYIISKVNDNLEFLLAYKLFDAPAINTQWQILSELEYRKMVRTHQPTSIKNIFPIENPPPPSNPGSLKRRIAVWLYSRRSAFWLFSQLPNSTKFKLKQIFR